MPPAIRPLFGALLLMFLPAAWAGPLTPPGPPGPTFRTLGEIEPRVPLRSDGGAPAPLVIDEPGSYYLARNVMAVAGHPAIRISASDVTLDLNGFTVRGNPDAVDGDGIRVEGANVTIRNGTVRGADEHGIHCPNGGPLTLIDVNAFDNGQSGANCVSMRVVGGQFSNNEGIGVGGLSVLITGVRASGNGIAGVVLGNGSAASRSMATGNPIGFNCANGPGLVTESIAKGNTVNRIGCAVFDSEIP